MCDALNYPAVLSFTLNTAFLCFRQKGWRGILSRFRLIPQPGPVRKLAGKPAGIFSQGGLFMKKKVLSILLAVCLLVGALPLVVNAYGRTWNCTYDEAAKTMTFTGSGWVDPREIGVDRYDAPRDWDHLNKAEKLVFEHGITRVESHYMYDGDRGDILNAREAIFASLPDTLGDIDGDSFGYSSKLKDVVIDPKNPNLISSNNIVYSKDGTEVKFCPQGAKKGAIALPGCVTKIGRRAFALCKDLTYVKIPDGVTSIGSEAFWGCEGLTYVNIPDGVTSIDYWTFYNCNALRTAIIPPSVTKIHSYAFRCYSGSIENLTIYGVAGSYAETYATDYKIPFKALDQAPAEPEESEITPEPVPKPGTDPVDPDPVDPDPVDPGPVNPGPVDPAPIDPDPVDPSPEKPIQFNDIPAGAYYADAVKWAVENGIAAGTDETHFSPNAPCTRAQAVTFLWRAAGKPEPQGAAAQFTDIKADSYYEKAVQWAVEQGITSGTGGGKFSPGAACTRAQIVAFLYRAQGSPEITGSGSFHDVKAGAYYENAVKWAVENNITAGTGGNQFSPGNDCIRGQIVTFLYRYSK